MKNLLTTIGLSTTLLIAVSAKADVSVENYNSHANNHIGYAEAHSGTINKSSQPNTATNDTTFEHIVLPDESDYNAHAFNHVSYDDAISGKTQPLLKMNATKNNRIFQHIVLPDEANYNPHEFNHLSYKEAVSRTNK